MWPWSTIKALQRRLIAADCKLDEFSDALTARLMDLQAEQRAHSETMRSLELARAQREQLRVNNDNLLRDIAVEQEKARKAILELDEVKGWLVAANREAGNGRTRIKALEAELAEARKNDARDKATGKYVRGARGVTAAEAAQDEVPGVKSKTAALTGPSSLAPVARPPRVRKPKAVKP